LEYNVPYRGEKYVPKHVNMACDRIPARDMYLKKLKLLESLRGHANVIDICGYCYSERAFMLDYMSFRLTVFGSSVDQYQVWTSF